MSTIKLIQDSIIRKGKPYNPIKEYKITTSKNNNVILVESNLSGYELVRMYFPYVLPDCINLDSCVNKFESVDQVNRVGFTIYIRELENKI